MAAETKAQPQRKRHRSRAKKALKSKDSGAKGKPWTFPKNTLESAITIAKAIEDKNAGNPMPAQELVVAVGFRLASDWRFLDLLRSANLYGLVSGTGASNSSISLTQLGQDVVAPSSPSQRSTALLAAFRNVRDFAAVEGFYGGKRIPEDEFFLNTLTREFQIPRDRVEQFAGIFLENLKFLRAFSASPASSDQTIASTEAPPSTTPPDKIPSPVVSRGASIVAHGPPSYWNIPVIYVPPAVVIWTLWPDASRLTTTLLGAAVAAFFGAMPVMLLASSGLFR